MTAVAYSRCGRYIVTGECGINPSIKVWELEANGQAPETGSNTAGTVVAEFTGHKNAVSCVVSKKTSAILECTLGLICVF